MSTSYGGVPRPHTARRGVFSLNKRTIAILSGLSLVLFIVGIVVFSVVVGGAVAACANSTDPNCAAGAAGTAGISTLIFVVAGILGLIGWIMALVKTAQIARWGWFVAVLLLNPIGPLIYGLAGPTEKAQA